MNTINREATSTYLGLEYDDLIRFERAIDVARKGYLYDLFEYMGARDEQSLKKYDRLFCLQNYNWQEELPKVEQLIKILQKANL